MKINWKIRVQNPYFWFGLIGVILTAMGVKPEMFTDWGILCEQVMTLLGNPFMLGSVIVAVVGVLFDPTTKGVGDSSRALSYREPGGDKK